MKPWTNLLQIVRAPCGAFHVAHVGKDKKRYLWNHIEKKWQQVNEKDDPVQCRISSHADAYDVCKVTDEPPQ